MKQKLSIVYVNFSPYDNAGRILDFLCSTFDTVIHFSYDHLRLKNGRKTNILTIYSHGHIIQQKKLFPLRTPDYLRFFSLPGVAALILFQTLWYTYTYKPKHTPINFYFSVNAYTAVIGVLMQSVRLIGESIFWVWDYYPPSYPDWRMMVLRRVYWLFDKPAIRLSSRVIFISQKLITLRQKLGVLKSGTRYQIIPIGTNPYGGKIKLKKKPIIGFLGMLKSSQGLDLLAESLPTILTHHPDIRVEIIGSGPEEHEIRQRFKPWASVVTFYGYVEKEQTVDRIIRRWSMGIATYLPEVYNESYWTDPSKIKAYLSQGVPVITTNVPQFSKKITSDKAGIVISYEKDALIHAIDRIIFRQTFFAKNAHTLAQKYMYKTLYHRFFTK